MPLSASEMAAARSWPKTSETVAVPVPVSIKSHLRSLRSRCASIRAHHRLHGGRQRDARVPMSELDLIAPGRQPIPLVSPFPVGTSGLARNGGIQVAWAFTRANHDQIDEFIGQQVVDGSLSAIAYDVSLVPDSCRLGDWRTQRALRDESGPTLGISFPLRQRPRTRTLQDQK